MLPGYKTRVCNSEDPLPETVERGVCREPLFEYDEIRIQSQNWDGAIFGTMVLQIVLSELLDVPATIETGTFDAKLNFYHPDSPFGYGAPYDWKAFEGAAAKGNVGCTKSDRSKENYQSCANAVIETYSTKKQNLVKDGIVLPPQFMGNVIDQTWHITKFSAERDPSLISYFGLRGMFIFWQSQRNISSKT